MSRLRRFFPLLGFLFASVAMWLLWREMRGFHPSEVGATLRSLPAWRIAAALLLTAINYGVLTGYDALALKYVRQRIPYRKTALASFIGYAFSISLGHAVLTGGAVRFRLYTAWGVPADKIARIVAFCGFAFWIGYLSLGGLVFVVDPIRPPAGFPLDPRLLGAAFLALFAGWLALNVLRTGAVSVGKWTFDLPGWKMTVAQTAVASTDLTLAASVLWMLIPPDAALSFPHLLSAYLIAVIAGVVSMVPGGLGVFDGLLIALLTPSVSAPVAVGALLAYRAVYYVLPLLAAVLTLVATELRWQRKVMLGRISALGEVTQAWLPRLVPRALAALTFVAGSVLLVSGALPAIGSRVDLLADMVPLVAVELSHFAGSVAGAALLVIARGLWLRRDGAYWMAAVLLALGSVAALLRAGDVEEAGLLALSLVALVPCHRFFTRRSALLGGPATPGWGVAVALVLLGTFAVGLFAFREVGYAHDLWWRFAFRADAPRFLRGMAGASAVVLVAGLVRLLRATPLPAGVAASPASLQRARAAIARSSNTEACLALLGDKNLLFAPEAAPGGEDDGFVMYAAQGASWISMGAPVGPDDTVEDLYWDFRAAAEAAGARPVFYEVPRAALPNLIDLGMALYKLGEEAHVPLAGFTMDGGAKKNLRRTLHRIEALCVLEIVSPADVGTLLPALRRVSDAWLGGKAGAEKGFSLGVFSESYLANFPLALVRLRTEDAAATGEIVAFANLWANDRLAGTSPGPQARSELSVDLMRFDRERAPDGVMEYLFAKLMLWGAAEGYSAFSLGMSPLSGLASEGDTGLAPLWNRAGALLFRHGEHFYNFQGLCAYKNKFDPVWTPRYLAVPPGRVALAAALVDVAALVSGGLGGLIRK